LAVPIGLLYHGKVNTLTSFAETGGAERAVDGTFVKLQIPACWGEVSRQLQRRSLTMDHCDIAHDKCVEHSNPAFTWSNLKGYRSSDHGAD
jgi:hypothetical protein